VVILKYSNGLILTNSNLFKRLELKFQKVNKRFSIDFLIKIDMFNLLTKWIKEWINEENHEKELSFFTYFCYVQTFFSFVYCTWVL